MERTGQNIQLSRLKKPNKTKDLLRGEYRIAYLISSQVRYDHFDTAPWVGGYYIAELSGFQPLEKYI